MVWGCRRDGKAEEGADRGAAGAVRARYRGASAGADDLRARLRDYPPRKGLPAFALELVNGVLDNKDAIDKTIGDTAPAFPVDQMAAIDRNILRLAIYELLIDNKVPMRAAINEAVELAKEFGGENSPRFINGVLGSVSVLTTR